MPPIRGPRLVDLVGTSRDDRREFWPNSRMWPLAWSDPRKCIRRMRWTPS